MRTRVTAPRPGPPGATTSPESGTAVCDSVEKTVKGKTLDTVENLLRGLFVVVWFQDTQFENKFEFGIQIQNDCRHTKRTTYKTRKLRIARVTLDAAHPTEAS